MGEKDVAIPFSDVRGSVKNGKWYLVLYTTKDALKTAPGFTYDKTKTSWIPCCKIEHLVLARPSQLSFPGVRHGSLLERARPERRAALLRTGVGTVPFGPAYTMVPNKTPTPAVAPMASAPQNVTRIMLGMTLAPPARAAIAPKSARKSSEVPDTEIIRLASGAKAVTNKGMAAPTAKLPAEASAA